MQALLIKAADGSIEDFGGERQFSIKEVQTMVGGHFAVWPGKYYWRGQRCIALVDEEAMMKENQIVNTAVTFMVNSNVLGDVLVLIGETGDLLDHFVY